MSELEFLNHTTPNFSKINLLVIIELSMSSDAVCSHGHTILHQPNKGITLQIGNLPEIATYNQKSSLRFWFKMFNLVVMRLVQLAIEFYFEYDYCLNLGVDFLIFHLKKMEKNCL
jgi:anhydro-N-acetylmuramic acid kinase